MPVSNHNRQLPTSLGQVAHTSQRQHWMLPVLSQLLKCVIQRLPMAPSHRRESSGRQRSTESPSRVELCGRASHGSRHHKARIPARRACCRRATHRCRRHSLNAVVVLLCGCNLSSMGVVLPQSLQLLAVVWDVSAWLPTDRAVDQSPAHEAAAGSSGVTGRRRCSSDACRTMSKGRCQTWWPLTAHHAPCTPRTFSP